MGRMNASLTVTFECRNARYPAGGDNLTRWGKVDPVNEDPAAAAMF
jgi:hypothetical protein